MSKSYTFFFHNMSMTELLATSSLSCKQPLKDLVGRTWSKWRLFTRSVLWHDWHRLHLLWIYYYPITPHTPL